MSPFFVLYKRLVISRSGPYKLPVVRRLLCQRSLNERERERETANINTGRKKRKEGRADRIKITDISYSLSPNGVLYKCFVSERQKT
jgi:hypothetical protein